MKTLRPLLLGTLLLVSAALTDGRAGLINTIGTFKLFEDKLIISVTEQEGRIQFAVGNSRFSGGITKNEAFPANSPWFLYPAGPDEVWAFYGSGPLHLITVKASSVQFDDSEANPGLLKTAPLEVLAAHRKSAH